MRRKVFWSSVKMTVGHILIGVYNIFLVMLLNNLIFENTAVAWLYFFTVPMLSGIVAYRAIHRLKDYQVKSKLEKQDMSKLLQMRKNIIEKIERLIPVA